MPDYRLIPAAVDPQTRLALRLADLESRLSRIESGLLRFTGFTYANGWRTYNGGTAYGGFGFTNGYWKDDNGFVYLQGLIDKNGGNFVAGEILMTGLPVPDDNKMISPRIGSSGGENNGRCDVNTSGQLILQVGGLANPVGWVNLTGFVYKAA